MDLNTHQFSQITVTSKQSGSTPGFRVLFPVEADSHYMIEIVGSRTSEVPVRVWIGSSQMQTLLFSEKYTLEKGPTTVGCPFYTGDLTLLYIGLLFSKSTVDGNVINVKNDDSFTIDRFAIKKMDMGHPHEEKLSVDTLPLDLKVPLNLDINACRSYGFQKLLPSNRTYVVDINCMKGELLSAILQAKVPIKQFIGYSFDDESIEHNRKTFKDPMHSFYKKNVIDYAVFRDSHPDTAHFCYGFLGYIEKDHEFLMHMPKNALLLFSVPKQCSDNPVRSFKSSQDITERYGFIMKFREIAEIKTGEEVRFHCIGDVI